MIARRLIFTLAFILPTYCVAMLAENQIILTRDNSTIVLEPYAPNIIRVNLSLLRDRATAAPGYGFVASPRKAGTPGTPMTPTCSVHPAW